MPHPKWPPSLSRFIRCGCRGEEASQRLAAGIKPQSIGRELSQPIAALRRASRKHRLGWVIEPPHLDAGEAEKRKVLSHEEQRKLLSWAMTAQKPHVAATLLVQLQIGGMASEVEKLELHLDAAVPHVILRQGKTKDRPRVAPIVLAEDFVQEHLPEAQEWLRGTSDSSWSWHLKRGNSRQAGNKS